MLIEVTRAGAEIDSLDHVRRVREEDGDHTSCAIRLRVCGRQLVPSCEVNPPAAKGDHMLLVQSTLASVNQYWGEGRYRHRKRAVMSMRVKKDP